MPVLIQDDSLEVSGQSVAARMVWDPDVKRSIIGALDVLSSLLAVLMLLAGTVIGGRAGAVEGAAIVGPWRGSSSALSSS
ncbi:hypothetical protein [Benzoatithermus flavus]|uniref:RDD family protein n=1 Tax=Benzoatithermus flavus TaxID=3108223 RepID=A0ABU8XUC8_9PROT